ncbi:MAG: HAMP domain-containing histidine kinase [Cytophagales bacterium]|jgi:signal transduction histidine kinase|nr:HAMP domain-containing histidine kinase [Cytophagales bacterium]
MDDISSQFASSAIRGQFMEWESVCKELEKVSFEMNTLVYRLSHDLNTPLTSVLGLVDLIEADNADVSRHYLSLIRTRVHRMRNTIRDLLYTSRLQNQLTVLEKADLNTLIQQDVLEMEELTRTRVVVETKIVGEQPVRTDVFRFRVVLGCLLSNAVQYADLNKPQPTVLVHAHCTPDRLILTVKDNGIGISAEQQPHVFDMFYRGTHTSNGSGLGLFLVKKAVEQMEGKISLKSEEGAGTRVQVILPNHRPADA